MSLYFQIIPDGIADEEIQRSIPGPVLMSRNGDCPVCLGQHDHEVHQATLDVRQWFREEVTRNFWIFNESEDFSQEPFEVIEATA